MCFGIPKFRFSTQNKYGRLILKAFYVRPSEFIIFGHWKCNMLNFMSMIYVITCKGRYTRAIATGKNNVIKVREIIENDGKYTVRDIAKVIVI